MINKVIVTSLDKKFKKFEKSIKLTTSKILRILNKTNVLAEIYLINSQKMRFLNKKFRGKPRNSTELSLRGKDKTTTVLSFQEPKGFISPASKFKKIGEIYLNLDNPELITHNSKLYLIHGLLHLFGYNHKKKSDRIRMKKKEQYVHNRSRHRDISN